jgi:hypothetical protein
MPRRRDLKPGFFENEDLSALSPLTRLLFAGLWCWADRRGILEDRPKRIKVNILPYDDCNVDVMLNELATAGFIVRYEVSGRRCIGIVTFARHQKPHPHETKSELPDPPLHGTAEPLRDMAESLHATADQCQNAPAKECKEKDRDRDRDRDRAKGRDGDGVEGEEPPGFVAFWVAYPRKVNKQAAIKAWRALKPDDTLQETFLAALARQKTWPSWLKDSGQYIPYPTTWLKGRRWEDENPQPNRGHDNGRHLGPRIHAREGKYDSIEVLKASDTYDAGR